MSHSTVLVIGPTNDDDLAKALSPFDENIRMEPYRDYVDPLPAGWETSIDNSRRFRSLIDGGMERRDAWATVWGERNDDPSVPFPLRSAFDAGVDPHDLAAVAAWYSARYPDSDSGYAVDENGLYSMSTYNPQSRWDWYSVGGRWSGSLVLRPGVETAMNGNYDALHADRAAWGTIDWERMGVERVEQRRKTWREAQSSRDPEFLYDVKPGQSEEEFVRDGVAFTTFAILTPDGEWLERGKMVWFGVAIDEKDQQDWNRQWHAICDRYCDPETVVTVVDVHI